MVESDHTPHQDLAPRQKHNRERSTQATNRQAPLTTGQKGPNWVVHYRDPSGKEHSKIFAKEKDAKTFDAKQVRDLAMRIW